MKQKRDILLHEGRYLRLMNRGGWEFVERAHCEGVVAVVALTPERKLILVEQYRAPVDCAVIEFPAGLVGDPYAPKNDTFEKAALRELLEETGWRAGKIQFLASGPLNAGMNSGKMIFYKARDLEKVGGGGGDETENIRAHEVALEEVDGWLEQKKKEGLLVDPKVYAGLYFLEQ